MSVASEAGSSGKVKITFCLRDRFGAYASVLGRLAGLQGFVHLSPKGHNPNDKVDLPSFVRIQHTQVRELSVVRGSAFLTSRKLDLQLRKNQDEQEYRQAVRTVLVLGPASREDQKYLQQLLAPYEAEELERFQQQTSWRVLELIRSNEAHDGCPEIRRCPFTSAKTWIQTIIVERTGPRDEEYPTDLRGYVPSLGARSGNKDVALDSSWGEMRDYLAEFEVRIQTDRQPGVFCVLANNLLLRHFPPANNQQPERSLRIAPSRRLVVNIALASTEVCDDTRYTFETFYGTVQPCRSSDPRAWIIEHVIDRPSWTPIAAAFIQPAGDSDQALAAWERYVSHLTGFLNSVYGKYWDFVACRLRPELEILYREVGGPAASEVALPMKVRPLMCVLRLERTESPEGDSFPSRVRSAIESLMKREEGERAGDLKTLGWSKLGFVHTVIDDHDRLLRDRGALRKRFKATAVGPEPPFPLEEIAPTAF